VKPAALRWMLPTANTLRGEAILKDARPGKAATSQVTVTNFELNLAWLVGHECGRRDRSSLTKSARAENRCPKRRCTLEALERALRTGYDDGIGARGY
jgi:hypothetical protein